MSALVRMRLAAFVRTGRFLAPLLTTLIVLGVLYGGGQAQPGEAYGVSAVVLFPVLAWQSKLLLDTEADVARRMVLVAAGRWREAASGLLAAGLTALVTVVLALAVPWLVGGITGPRDADDLPLAQGVAIGVWAHLLALPAAVALGALASRVVTGGRAPGLAVLALGSVAALVLDSGESAAGWTVPPLLATARASTAGPVGATVVGLTVWAVTWSGAALAGYLWLRRRRA